MPYVPEFQLTGIWRSTFEVASMPAFFQAAVAYTGARWNDLDRLDVPARQEMSAYSLTNIFGGIEKESWTATFYVNNLFDERAEIDIDSDLKKENRGWSQPAAVFLLGCFPARGVAL